MKIGVSTGGGDCPGLNPAIRAIVKRALDPYGIEAYGIQNSFDGVMKRPFKADRLELADVTNILNKGGTILGTHNSGNPYAGDQGPAHLQKTVEGVRELGLDCVISIGGEGTQGISQQLIEAGINIIGIPKTIDNDLPGTEQTLGFASAVEVVAEAVERLQSTAESHDRIMVLEVMGRDSGYIALHGGLAGGAHVILLPEIPFQYESIIKKINDRKKMGRNYSVVVVSEGALEKGGDPQRPGVVGAIVAEKLQELTQMETRVTVLGHLQRGGAPSYQDRILATRFGVYAVDLAAKKQFNQLVVMKNGAISHTSYADIPQWQRRVIDPKDSVLNSAEGIGICLGR